MSAAAPAEAVIVSGEIGAGHDGEAELVLRVAYENGIVGTVVLDAAIGFELMRKCGIDRIEDLAGQSWRKIL